MSLSPTNRGSPQLAVPLELESFYECPIELDGLVTFHADVAAFRAGFQVSALNVSARHSTRQACAADAVVQAAYSHGHRTVITPASHRGNHSVSGRLYMGASLEREPALRPHQ